MSTSLDLVTFGEAMLRLSPPGCGRLEQAVSLDIHVGGSELNSAVTSQRLGLSTSFVTRLPRTPLGRLIANKAREHGVDTDWIHWVDEDRVGTYFVEFGASPRPTRVIYDRAHSAIAKVRPGEMDWDAILADAKCFHTSGITPALSESAAREVTVALRVAKDAGAIVSFDVNYRRRLWSPERAREVLTPLMDFVDILLTTEEDAERVFGIVANDHAAAAAEIVSRFGLQVAAITLRENTLMWRNRWSGIAHDGTRAYVGPEFDLELVDRVGGGDAFTGGFLGGYLRSGDVQEALDTAIAASAIGQTNPGDLNWVTPDEVSHLLQGGGKRIDR
ncbi:PfkB family carbohydrate kinase [Candidatus Bipolaricaulota bacterium]